MILYVEWSPYILSCSNFHNRIFFVFWGLVQTFPSLVEISNVHPYLVLLLFWVEWLLQFSAPLKLSESMGSVLAVGTMTESRASLTVRNTVGHSLQLWWIWKYVWRWKCSKAKSSQVVHYHMENSCPEESPGPIAGFAWTRNKLFYDKPLSFWGYLLL